MLNIVDNSFVLNMWILKLKLLLVLIGFLFGWISEGIYCCIMFIIFVGSVWYR